LLCGSLLAVDGGSFRSQVSGWMRNNAMCALTEQVVFAQPYMTCEHNRWTSPQLDRYVAGIQADTQLKVAAAHWKNLFLTQPQALLHGDLHTGSVMVHPNPNFNSTYVIDPEFAFYGPMGFDIGAILANLYLCYFSTLANNEKEYGTWILQQAALLWNTFHSAFLDQWAFAAEKGVGELYPSSIYSGVLLEQVQKEYLTSVWRDTVGFAGVKMIRRVIGIAHVEDLESIQDADKRAVCEKASLIFARKLSVSGISGLKEGLKEGLKNVEDLNQWAQEVYESVPNGDWVV